MTTVTPRIGFRHEGGAYCDRDVWLRLCEEKHALMAEAIRERGEAIALLRRAEWGGEAWGEPACPECNGLMPPPHAADPAYDARTVNRFGVGHRSDCDLARLLSRFPEGGEG